MYDEVQHTVAHRLQGTTEPSKANEVHWPAELHGCRFVDAVVRRVHRARRPSLGEYAQEESSRWSSWLTGPHRERLARPSERMDLELAEPFYVTATPLRMDQRSTGRTTLRATVAVRERSARILRGLDSLAEGSTKSTLLVAESLCSSCHIAAVTLPVSGIGKRWKPVIRRRAAEPLRIDWEKSMAVWFNSTLGVLSLLASGCDSVDPHFTDENARWMPVPVLSTRQTETLAQVHDAHCSTALLRIAEADHDPVRLALDEAVCRVLGCDATEVSASQASARCRAAAQLAVGCGGALRGRDGDRCRITSCRRTDS